MGGGAQMVLLRAKSVITVREGFASYTFITFIATSFETSLSCCCAVSSSCLLLHFRLMMVSIYIYIYTHISPKWRESVVGTSNLAERCVQPTHPRTAGSAISLSYLAKLSHNSIIRSSASLVIMSTSSYSSSLARNAVRL